MKINEITQPLVEFQKLGLLHKFFGSEKDLKDEIIRYADKVMQAYYNRMQKTHERVAFSNEIGNFIREATVKVIADKYRIFSEKELANLKYMVYNTVSLPYMEFKLNKIMY